MGTPKRANVFVFTEWHLQQQGMKPCDWPPFNPPDKRSLREMLADIHQQRDRLLSPDLLDDEKMELIPVDVGPEVILADGEPKWNLVWGVIVDRSAASIRDNARKLRKMAREIRNTVAERAGMQPVLFLVPGGNGETPPPLAEFKKSFRVFNVPDSTFLITLAAITLVEDSQVSDSEVARWMRRTL